MAKKLNWKWDDQMSHSIDRKPVVDDLRVVNGEDEVFIRRTKSGKYTLVIPGYGILSWSGRTFGATMRESRTHLEGDDEGVWLSARFWLNGVRIHDAIDIFMSVYIDAHPFDERILKMFSVLPRSPFKGLERLLVRMMPQIIAEMQYDRKERVYTATLWEGKPPIAKQ